MAKWLLEKALTIKKKFLARKPRFKEKPQKIIVIKATYLSRADKPIIPILKIVVSIENKMKTIISTIKYSNKIHELESYDKATNDQIYKRYW